MAVANGSPMTSADVIGAYYKELLEAGISHETAEEIVRDYAHGAHADGQVTVRRPKDGACVAGRTCRAEHILANVAKQLGGAYNAAGSSSAVR